MSLVLQRIEQTREALMGALLERDWEAIGKLDETCRACIDDVLSEASMDEDLLREKLEGLLAVYRQLVEVTTGERQAIVDEMTQVNQAKNAAKVYDLFG
ncbi:hypothetical protein SAMN04487857_104279 [Pseudomonas sp. ok272]|uniref:flagellar protein FliT n=1 Tax=unclassified Pseudomonas TaxID=196821 RepID=UPI0008BB9994|nr:MULTISPECIES: flagellar protein FliT [unclassified Pseudomonas]SEM73084.1 hypothetical protein SAMN04487857_104279 [Pseudomonas sp. ok272]SFM61827.1 hypothetical protein SAMN04487858_104279 [Pseudomonas sp. ok602]